MTIIRASVFEDSRIRFRAQDGGDEYSECQLVCIDIWRLLTPVKPLVGRLPPPLRPVGSKEFRAVRELRGARIQVVPRVSVGYLSTVYEAVRKDLNTTAWEMPLDTNKTVEVVQEWSDAFEIQEKVEWSVWPPKRVAHFPYGKH